jgi:hypothetical protein
VKADRFRYEWGWTGILGKEMSRALFSGDWKEIYNIAGKVQKRLAEEKISATHRQGTPWVGAWEKLQANKHS